MSNKIEKILRNLPKSPGIYQFFDKKGEIIYVGKSVNLKNRVNSYFKANAKLNFAKKKMLKQIFDIKIIIVNNETESLILETNLIKNHKPKYNILMKDDKNHLYIKITDDKFPKIIKTRQKTKSGEYFGPYLSSTYVEQILKFIKKHFGYGVSEHHFFHKKSSYNLDKYLFKTSSTSKSPYPNLSPKGERNKSGFLSPMGGEIQRGGSNEEQEEKIYNQKISQIRDFLKRDFKKIIPKLEEKMQDFAKNLEFERASEVKKTIDAIKSLEINQIARDGVKGDYDIINYLEKYDRFFIGHIILRDSKIVGMQNFEIENKLEEEKEEILQKFIEQNIIVKNLEEGRKGKVKVIVPPISNSFPPREKENNKEKNCHSVALSSILNQVQHRLGLEIAPESLKCKNTNYDSITSMKGQQSGRIKYNQVKDSESSSEGQQSGKVVKGQNLLTINYELKTNFETPKIGPKKELLELAYKNIYEYAYKKHLSSLSTKGFTKKNMQNLLEILGYKQINKNIIFECNDISHISGNHTVASRSVIENGKVNPSKYKKYKIKNLEEQKIDDFASMREVMTRRIKEMENLGNIPDLIIIDGGKGQLNSVTSCKLQVKSKDGPNPPILNPFLQGEKGNNNPLSLGGRAREGVQLVSIAKREEELFLPGKSEPIILDKDSRELKLIQKIRDEAHRFAISFNRSSRIKSMKKNILESLPGFGPKTRKKILKNFKSVDNLKNIGKNELKKFLNKRQIEVLEEHSII